VRAQNLPLLVVLRFEADIIPRQLRLQSGRLKIGKGP
jgi:hypothetical protein